VFLALAVVLSPDVASASTPAPGSLVFNDTTGTVTFSCATSDPSCPDPATYTRTRTDGYNWGTVAAGWTPWAYRSDVDPRLSWTATSDWPGAHIYSGPPAGVTKVAATTDSGTVKEWAGRTFGTGRYLVTTSFSSGNSQWYVSSIWDLGAAATAPATSSAPATTAAPTSAPATTTAPATGSAPASSTSSGASSTSASGTSSAPTTGTTTPTDPGTGGTGGSTTTPTTTVVTLSDDQWGDVLLAMGATTFCSCASLVASFRRGR
jgi:hypothetical protein